MATQRRTHLNHQKWVIVALRHPSHLEYIMAIEQVCHKLIQQDAEELSSEINRVLKGSHAPKPIISKIEYRDIQQLKWTKQANIISRKGMAVVIMDKQDYMNSAKNLLEQPAYRPLPADPSNKYRAKLINILKRLKKESGMDDHMYGRIIQPAHVLPGSTVFLKFIIRKPYSG